MNKTSDNNAAKLANDLANAVYEAFDNNIEKLSQMEDILCFIFELLDSKQFILVLQILSDTMDCPVQDNMFFISETYCECYTRRFMDRFADKVWSTANNETQQDTGD